jgi:hypothetical protein
MMTNRTILFHLGLLITVSVFILEVPHFTSTFNQRTFGHYHITQTIMFINISTLFSLTGQWVAWYYLDDSCLESVV